LFGHFPRRVLLAFQKNRLETTVSVHQIKMTGVRPQCIRGASVLAGSFSVGIDFEGNSVAFRF